MTFDESVDYLLSLGNEVEAMKLGLENIRALLDELGDPQTRYLKVQVAGTNGKGSVCAFLDSICREANIRTGLYTSPHLVSITERIRVDGENISEDEFARLATRVRATAETMLADRRLAYRPTFFEQVTAIALVAFAEAKVDLAILETGLGGRLDATTAANAEIAAITRIDLDHQQYLGDTIEEIAAEKAAIIGQHSRSVVIGEQQPVAMDVIAERVKITSIDDRQVRYTADAESNFAALGLRGKHQVENAKVAALIADALRQYFAITDDNISTGVANAKHPGRLEYIGNFLLDGAHNPAGARALAEFIDEFERRPITLIFGAMNDKNVAEMLAILVPLAERIVFTQPANPRALTADELVKLLPRSIDLDRVTTSDDVKHAIDIARSSGSPNNVVLLTGSLYLVGEAKQILESQI